MVMASIVNNSLKSWLFVAIMLLASLGWSVARPCEEMLEDVKEELRKDREVDGQLTTHLANLAENVDVLIQNGVPYYQSIHKGEHYGCDIPSSLKNGQVWQAVDWFGKPMVSFTCQKGFTLIGSPTLVCIGGSWNSSLPQCAAKDCKAHKSNGHNKNGLYGVLAEGTTPILVYCDMTTAGGGWTVIQRRVDDTENFYRSYVDYQRGFGNLTANFWLGLDNIHTLTQDDSEIYVDMVANETHKAYAQYSTFKVGDAAGGYVATVTGYSGNAGNAFTGNGQAFSTYDHDRDIHSDNCAALFKGGWWYTNCHSSNLNGKYLNGSHPAVYAQGINWYPFTGHYYSLRRVETKIRRKY